MEYVTVSNASGQSASGNADITGGPRIWASVEITTGNPSFIMKGGYYTLTWRGVSHSGFLCTQIQSDLECYQFRQP